MESKSIEKKFGLIGRGISYSFSKKFFTDKFEKLMLKNHTYEIFDIENLESVHQILNTENLVGLNVTIPYKEKITPYLDELSDEAKEIGAVNTIHIIDGKKFGYNTDVTGFENTLQRYLRNPHTTALVLGNGGAAKAVIFVLKKHNISYEIVSRKGNKTFNELTPDEVNQNKLIIQCTPVGTFPNVGDCLDFPFSAITEEHLVIDLIYNPMRTQFILNSAKMGAKTVNGMYMLEQQAEKSWSIWTSEIPKF